MAPISFTIFPDVKASKQNRHTADWEQIVDRIRAPRSYDRKEDCSLIKLAVFGDKPNDKNCLRYTENIIEITGLEGDYDGEIVSISDASMLVFSAGVEAVFYTSPRHTPERPRWRILCPLSHPHKPIDRSALLARINGILGGILGPESFTLVQSFFIGAINGAQYDVQQTRGRCIDEIEGLPETYPPKHKQEQSKKKFNDGDDPVLRSLEERGFIKSAGKDHSVNIICPFSSTHTQEDKNETATVYFPPHTGGYSTGRIACLHGHCVGRSMDEYRQELGLPVYAKQAPPEQHHKPPDVGVSGWPRITEEQRPTHLCTDLRNAWRIAETNGKDLMHVADHSWYSWTSKYWRRGHDEAFAIAGELSRAVAAEAAKVFTEASLEANTDLRQKKTSIGEALAKHATKCEQRATIESAFALSKKYLTIHNEELDCNHFLLNVMNGTLDLKNGQLRSHDRADLITRCCDVVYDQAAQCPLWMSFIDRIFGGNSELIEFIQRSAGYALTGSVKEEVVFFLYGHGCNGKSVFIGTLQRLLGLYAKTAAPDLLMVGERHPTDLADLQGARLVSFSESGEGRRLNETLVKWLSGDEIIKARHMREDNFEFMPEFKCFLSTNHRPVIRGTDHAIWRRIRLVPFEVTIPEAERDLNLSEKLKAELPGILTWCVKGCLDWQSGGLSPPRVVLDATDAYRGDMDVFAQFLEEVCVLAKDAEIRASYLYKAFTNWCERNGERGVTQTAFGQKLTERGLKRRTSNGMIWIGIRISEDYNSDENVPCP